MHEKVHQKSSTREKKEMASIRKVNDLKTIDSVLSKCARLLCGLFVTKLIILDFTFECGIKRALIKSIENHLNGFDFIERHHHRAVADVRLIQTDEEKKKRFKQKTRKKALNLCKRLKHLFQTEKHIPFGCTYMIVPGTFILNSWPSSIQKNAFDYIMLIQSTRHKYTYIVCTHLIWCVAGRKIETLN